MVTLIKTQPKLATGRCMQECQPENRPNPLSASVTNAREVSTTVIHRLEISGHRGRSCRDIIKAEGKTKRRVGAAGEKGERRLSLSPLLLFMSCNYYTLPP
jgi:hypothetical protein